MLTKRNGKFHEWIKENKYQILLFMLVLSVLFGVYLIITNKLNTPIEYTAYYGFIGTIFSISLTAVQFRATHDWNRRVHAITEAHAIKDKLRNETKLLHKKFGFLRLKLADDITVHKIHSELCEGKWKGSEYVLDRDSEGAAILKKDGGYETKMAIRNTLNAYEYLSAGILQGIFDERVICTLLKGPLLKARNNFSSYITHVNDSMDPDRGKRIWENLIEIAKRFEEYNKHQPDQRSQT